MIRRVNRGKGHYYEDTERGTRIPGVTTYTDAGIPKPALINWAATATAEYAVDHWDNLANMSPSERLKALQRARWAVKDAAANKGTKVHKLAERLVQGEKVAVPDELAGHVESYVRFLDEFDVQPVMVEFVVWNETHSYCGTGDLIGDLVDPDDPDGPAVRWLLDIKTNRSGIFGETALQLAGYRYAEFVLEDGELVQVPEVDLTGAVHVRADGYDLIPVEVGPTQFRQFLYAAQIADFVEHSRDLVGDPIEPPHTSRWTLTREAS